MPHAHERKGPLHLYFAAMNRLPHKRNREPVLDSMTNIVRRIGDLPPSWSHTYTTKKSKAGAILKHKLEVFHMDYEASKQIFNYANTEALYEVIDLAVGVNTNTNANWRYFMISFLNCLELLTLHRDYKPGEVDDLERRCKTMYTALVTKIGGIEGVTNYFHYVSSEVDMLSGCVVSGGICGATGMGESKLLIK